MNIITELQYLFKDKKRKLDNPKWNKYSRGGGINFIKEINNLNPNLVLDLGCGFNNYKGLIKNIVGVDILDNEFNLDGENGSGQDFFCDIRNLPFKDNTADIVLAFGSINFGDDEVIDSQFREAIRVLKRGGRFYFRGLPDHSHKLYYKWSIEKIIEKTEKFNLEFFIEPEIIHKKNRPKQYSRFDKMVGNRNKERIFCAWKKR